MPGIAGDSHVVLLYTYNYLVLRSYTYIVLYVMFVESTLSVPRWETNPVNRSFHDLTWIS